MRGLLKIALALSHVVNSCLALVLVRQIRSGNKFAANSYGPFSITNLNDSVRGDAYVVAHQNGKYWWTVDGEVLSMNAGLHQGMVLRLDDATGRVKSTTIELFDVDGAHCYFTDSNADGIPEQKRIGTNIALFLEGSFYPSKKLGDARVIVKDGQERAVTFDGKRWQPQNQR